MVVVRLRVAGYAEKVRTRSLSLVDMNRTLPETALNTKHVWPVWLRTENLIVTSRANLNKRVSTPRPH
jgi:hypothetical protein